MMILFTMETPDYQKLMKMIDELKEIKEAAEKAKQLEYAAKRKDYEYITLFHEQVMEYYEECINKIKKCF